MKHEYFNKIVIKYISEENITIVPKFSNCVCKLDEGKITYKFNNVNESTLVRYLEQIKNEFVDMVESGDIIGFKIKRTHGIKVNYNM